MKLSGILTLVVAVTCVLVNMNVVFSKEIYKKSTSAFIENKGQFLNQNNVPNYDVKFLLHTPGINVQLRKTGFSYDMCHHDTAKNLYSFNRVDVEFESANPQCEIIPQDKENSYLNYFTTGVSNDGEMYVNTYRKVLYKNIYPGIDILFYAEVKDLVTKFKYDLILAPGSDLNQVKFRYNGMNKLSLAEGKLIMALPLGPLSEEIPKSYYSKSGNVAKASFVLEDNLVSYSIENRSTDQELIIDPVPDRAWSTYYGGASAEYVRNVVAAKKSAGVFAIGFSTSSDKIATSGSYQSTYIGGEDCYIAKFNEDGVRQWATYFGGSNNDRAYCITVDPSDYLYISGESTSSNLPTTSGVFQPTHSGSSNDAFIAKFDPNGRRVWCTFYGGNGIDEAYRISLSRSFHLYVGGKTGSSNVIATAGAHQTTYNGSEDGFLLKMDTSGRRIWGTYYGGTRQDYVVGISVENDPLSDFFVYGLSFSSTNIASIGAYRTSLAGSSDVYLSYFDSSGKRKWATYFGGTGEDYANGMVCDSFSNAYIYGYTKSTTDIATSGAYQTVLSGSQDCFLAKFNRNGVRTWGTYFGGSGIESVYQADVYLRGYIVLAGNTTSTTQISTSNVWQGSLAGGEDGFMAKFSASDGRRIWGTYFGSSATDRIYAISLVKNFIYIGGITMSSGGMTSSSAHQTTFGGGGSDGFIAKFIDDSCFLFSISTTFKDACKDANDGRIVITPKDGKYPYTYTVGSTTSSTDSTFLNLAKGSYKVLTVDSRGCRDSLNVTINQATTAVSINSDTVKNVCFGTKTTLKASVSGGKLPYNYIWNANSSFNKDSLSGLDSGSYKLLVTDKDGCKDSAVLIVKVAQKLILSTQLLNPIKCFGDTSGVILLQANGGLGPFRFFRDTLINSVSDTLKYLPAGSFKIILTDSLNCLDVQSVTVNEPNKLVASFNLPDMFICNTSKIDVVGKAMGGTSPFLFHWRTSPPFFKDSIYNLSPGKHQLVITDSNGCKDSAIYSIEIASAVDAQTDSLHDVTCYGKSDGFVSIKVSGAMPPLTYQWDAGTPGNDNFYKDLEAGNYQCVVIDATGCRDTIQIQIKEPPRLALTLDSMVSAMCAYEKKGAAIAKAVGGIFPYSFAWKTTPVVNQNKIENLDQGTYTVVVSDSNGCRDSAFFTVRKAPVMGLVLQSKKDVSCFEGMNGSIRLAVSGGALPLKYQWSRNPLDIYDSLVNVSAGSYQFWVTDSFGCRDSLVVDITQPDSALQLTAEILDESCLGSANGEITLQSFGGVKPYQYLWEPAPVSNLSSIQNLSKGNYKLTITDANGCTIDSLFEVKQGDFMPNLVFPDDTVICAGDTISIRLYSARGMSYLWHDGSTLQQRNFTEKGTIKVTAMHFCGNQTDSFYLDLKNCGCVVHIPNAFTPTGDLLNESFAPVLNCDVSDYELLIFNRWGEKIFFSNNPNEPWNGYYKGKIVPVSSYLYLLNFVGNDGRQSKRFQYKGTVTVLR